MAYIKQKISQNQTNILSEPTSGSNMWQEFIQWFRQNKRLSVGYAKVFRYFIIKASRIKFLVSLYIIIMHLLFLFKAYYQLKLLQDSFQWKKILNRNYIFLSLQIMPTFYDSHQYLNCSKISFKRYCFLKITNLERFYFVAKVFVLMNLLRSKYLKYCLTQR
ncbi:unnamed protein product [Paramecium sonneborni]|uniref:Transmembrane protein n=1 Tax=Paramecium sonneborni TaxID=65129 RepID=A0A8S1PSR8_9CILI|nr:unnamed protein product [Paramecium sonneborni]